MGRSGQTQGHIAYICFRPKSDAFGVIEFPFPKPKEYKAFLKEDISRYTDDSVPELFPGERKMMRESLEATKEMQEKTEFSETTDRFGKPAVSQFIKEQWYQDHSKDFNYSLGFVFDRVYQDGLEAGSVSEFGEWSTLANNKVGNQTGSDAWFLGGFAWLERYNLQHGNVSSSDDDPEHGHIRVDPTTIYVHYKYQNPSKETVDYTIQIHRLTGRFIEAFESPDGSNQITGTCLIFR
jgi:hypothetical protein